MALPSAFDPSLFLDATTEEALEKRDPLPIGDYTAVIGEITARTWQGKSDPSKSGMAFDVPLILDIPAEIQVEAGLTEPTFTIKDSLLLDTTPQGAIDWGKGKNARLRKYREATDLNKPGEKFNPRMLQGKVITVKLKHEVVGDEIYERVAGVAMS